MADPEEDSRTVEEVRIDREGAGRGIVGFGIEPADFGEELAVAVAALADARTIK